MGCCESKLLGIEETPQIYEQNPITQNESYDGNLVHIAPVIKCSKKPDLTQKSIENNQSLFDLQIDLNKAFRCYEEKQGKVTYTCLVNAEQKTVRSTVNIKRNKEQISYNSILLDQDNSQTIYSNSSRNDSVYPTQILKDVTLNSTNNLEKELYWSQFAVVNGVVLKKWDNNKRKQIQFTREQCSMIFRELSKLQEFAIFLQLYWSTSVHKIKLIACSQDRNNQIGLRTFVNGFERTFIPLFSDTPTQKTITAKLIYQYCQHFYSTFASQHLKTISQLMYHLTGWLPQVIDMKEIDAHESMFERLSINVRNHNVMLCFICEESQQINVVEKIDCCQQQIVFSKVNKNIEQQTAEQLFDLQRQRWNFFLKDGISMCVNWNPSIYDYSIQCRLQFPLPSQQPPLSQLFKYPQIMLQLPPSTNQLEVRIFIEEHSSTYELVTHSKLLLFDYSGDRKSISEQIAVKTYEMNSKILTDIMLFESCPLTSRYLLILIPSDCEDQLKKISQFTLSFYSLTEIKAHKLHPTVYETKKQLKVPITHDNIGLGLTSPFYLKNQAFSLKIPPCHLLKIFSSPQINDTHLDYQLHLIPNHNRASYIVQLRPDDIATSQFVSPRFQNQGQLELEPQNTKFILVIVLHSISVENNILLKIECLDVEREKIFWNREISENQIEIESSYLSKVQQNSQYEVKWKEENPGLRNRTKQNTKLIYHEQKVFSTFFKNPFIDLEMEPGSYYLVILSKSYQIYFEKTYMKEIQDLSIEEKENAQALVQRPPNLSLGIFHILTTEKQEKTFKIIADDEFYVPFGFGFWCKKKIPEKGMYRFVFSKLQKCAQTGIFFIHKILQ